MYGSKPKICNQCATCMQHSGSQMSWDIISLGPGVTV